MKAKQFILMLLVMLGSVTGAWAQEESGSYGGIKWVYNHGTRSLTFSSVDPNSAPVAMPDYERTYERPWNDFANSALSVKFFNISYIGKNALADGMGISSVNIPNTVTSIGPYAFSGCWSLRSVTLPNSITSIGESAFWDCQGLTSVNIPNGVTMLSMSTFAYCKSLRSVNLPASITKLDYGAFEDCIALTSITLPASITKLGAFVFLGCTALKSIIVEAETPPSVVEGCFYDVDMTIPVYVPNSAIEAYKSTDGWKDFSNIQELYISGTEGDIKWEFNIVTKHLTISSIDPDSDPVAMYDDVWGLEWSWPWHYLIRDVISVKFVNISVIGNHTLFEGSDITSIDIPNTVTRIGAYAFSGCDLLKSIKIPNGVTVISDNAFQGCNSLGSLTLPASVTTLGRDAFDGCNFLTSITVEAETPPSVGYWCFDGVYKTIPVYVPCGKGDAYRSANGWKDFTNIIDHRYKHSGDPNSEEYYTCTVCGEIDPAYYHVHNYSDEWSFDRTHHWHACTSEEYPCIAPRKDESEHFTRNILNDEANYRCDVCGYVDEAKKIQYESRDYLSMTAVGGDVTIGFKNQGTPDNYTIQVSEDGNIWSEPQTLNTETTLATIPEGKTYYFRHGSARMTTHISNNDNNYWSFTMTSTFNDATVEAGGNVMTLLDMEGWWSILDKNPQHVFSRLFLNCKLLTVAPKIVTTTVGKWSFPFMFAGTSIRVAPELTATTVVDGAYRAMFQDCKELIKVPKLPASNLARCAYKEMFKGCEKLEMVEIADATASYDTSKEGDNPFCDWLDGTAAEGKVVTSIPMIGNEAATQHMPSNWQWATKLKLNEDPTNGKEGNFYTTFYDSRYDYKVEEGFKAYSGSVIDEELRLTATPDNIIPEGDGVLIHGGSGEVLLTVSDGSAERIAGNVLTGSNTDTTAPANCYILSYGQKGLGFYQYAAGKALSAHKAYLIKPAGAKALRMVFDEEDDADGISPLPTSPKGEETIYNLQGIRLGKLQKGINIVNGKKIIVR